MKRKCLVPFFALFVAAAACAADVDVKGAWVRGTVPAQKSSGAYMELTSKSDVTLVGASSPLAEAVEVHEMLLDGGVMKMRAVPRLALPAGKTVSFKSGGYHLMLLGLKRQLKPGETVPVELRVENAAGKAAAIAITMEVRELAEPSTAQHHQHSH